MGQTFQSSHFSTDGVPDGGQSFGPGFCIAWQRGTLGTGENRTEPNGAFVETIIEVAIGRLEHYQDSMFKCEENELAIANLRAALRCLSERTQRRERLGIEGTHKGT